MPYYKPYPKGRPTVIDELYSAREFKGLNCNTYYTAFSNIICKITIDNYIELKEYNIISGHLPIC